MTWNEVVLGRSGRWQSVILVEPVHDFVNVFISYFLLP